MFQKLADLMLLHVLPALGVFLFARRAVRYNMRLNPVLYPPREEKDWIRFYYFLAVLWLIYGILVFITGKTAIGAIWQVIVQSVTAPR